MKKKRKITRAKNVIYSHISNNIKEYVIVTLLFIIGAIVGVIMVNNSSEAQKQEITLYINNFINSLKNAENIIDKPALLKDAIKSNLLLAFLLWFMGCTVIGAPIVYAIIAYRGFTLSYTIASIIASLGGKGIVFSISILLLQNIIFIPTLFALAISGIRLYKSIMKDRRKENIKLEIYRHSIFCLILSALLVITSFLECYGSTTIAEKYIQYI